MSEMPAALARFFPLPGDVVEEYIDPSATPPTEPTEPTEPSESSERPAPSEPSEKPKAPKSYTDHALPAPLLLRVLETLLQRLAKLRAALAAAELRAVGASLLVVYESDPARLAQCFAALDEGRVRWKEDEEIDPDADSDSDGDGGDEADRLPVTLHLIDFAHTEAAPGQGADEGVLLGVDKFTELVKGRLEEVKKAMAGEEGGSGDEREPKKAKIDTT